MSQDIAPNSTAVMQYCVKIRSYTDLRLPVIQCCDAVLYEGKKLYSTD